MTQIQKKLFGTDGIRGTVGQYPITPDVIMKLGWAVGKVLASQEEGGQVFIGKDTRISGYMFESALETGIVAAGENVQLLGPLPTPAIAYLTRTFRAQAGVVISASHNGFEDNGIKFFSTDGFKLSDEIEFAIERQMEEPFTVVPSARLGKATRLNDAAGRYIEYCKSTIPNSCSLSGCKIVIDCANGAAYRIAPSVFRELGATVIALSTKPDGMNINDGCGSTQPELLRQTVLEEKAHLGIALDGDSDRLIMVDEYGAIVDGDELLYIIAKDRFQRGCLKGGVVGTHMSNMGLESRFRDLGIDFVRTHVGDRYVIEKLRKLSWCVGGEPSGHLICLGATTTGDGIIAALQVIYAMLHQGKNLHELRQEMIKFPQTLINVPVKESASILDHPEIQTALTAVKEKFKSKGRVLLRPSGTEPLLRVMVEGEDETQVTQSAEFIADLIRKLSSHKLYS